MNHFDNLGLQTGDIILLRTEGPLGFLIRAFGRAHTGGARVNHAGLVLSLEQGLKVWEAGPLGIRTRPLSVYTSTPCVIYRYLTNNTDETKAKMLELCLGLVGQSYGFLKLPLYALDGVGGWVTRVVFRQNKPFYFFSKSFGITHFKVCSNAVGYVYEKVYGRKDFFHIPWRSLTPDLIDDFCVAHGDWQIIGDSL